MANSQHDVAIFEEGFMLVAVNPDFVEDHGEKTVWKMVQGHPWVVEQEIPVVIVYDADDGSHRMYGAQEWVEAVSGMEWDDITWGHELTLEWED